MFFKKWAKDDDIEDKIVGIQKWMAFILFFILIGIILFNAFGDSDKTQMMNNSYLPIISGWIGIILGFYFSRELAGIISQKLKDSKKERKADNEKIRQEYERFKEDTNSIIVGLLKNRNKKQK